MAATKTGRYGLRFQRFVAAWRVAAPTLSRRRCWRDRAEFSRSGFGSMYRRVRRRPSIRLRYFFALTWLGERPRRSVGHLGAPDGQPPLAVLFSAPVGVLGSCAFPDAAAVRVPARPPRPASLTGTSRTTGTTGPSSTPSRDRAAIRKESETLAPGAARSAMPSPLRRRTSLIERLRDRMTRGEDCRGARGRLVRRCSA